MKKSFILCIIAASIFCTCSKKNITIEWDQSSLKFVTAGVYARVHDIGNGEFALVYERASGAWIRRSNDKCQTWSEEKLVARAEGYNYANSEILRLKSGRLLYMWNARPRVDSLPYKIMVAISDDDGKSWKEKTLYTASTKFQDGCWEPVAMQLPDGEIQLYFANEFPYKSSSEQEISMMRSKDNAESWSEAEKISFSANSRDGMPVPIYLPHSKEIAVAIEDNGIRGRFKPVIVRSANNWNDAPVLRSDLRREEALTPDSKVHDTVYAGAPYLIRLGKDHTLLSVQSTEGRSGTNERKANMQVYVGDRDARNFSNRSTPMPSLPQNGNALWNSLCQIDDQSVIAIMSVGGVKQGGIWSVTGKIKELE